MMTLVTITCKFNQPYYCYVNCNTSKNHYTERNDVYYKHINYRNVATKHW